MLLEGVNQGHVGWDENIWQIPGATKLSYFYSYKRDNYHLSSKIYEYFYAAERFVFVMRLCKGLLPLEIQETVIHQLFNHTIIAQALTQLDQTCSLETNLLEIVYLTLKLQNQTKNKFNNYIIPILGLGDIY